MKKEDAHVISMSRQFLGTTGKNTSWILYLFICYASLIAYAAGCGHMIASWLHLFFNMPLLKILGCALFMAIFGPVIFMNHRSLGRCNSYLFIAMCAIFLLLIAYSAPHIQLSYLQRSDFKNMWPTMPLLLTAFSFQTMVPSLHPYLNHNTKALRTAIIGGTSIAFFVYLIWQIIVHGTVPFEGVHGLKSALQAGEPATHSLGYSIGSNWINILAHGFSFFALVTSFLGMALGLYDFLSDGLQIPKKGRGNLLLGALIIVPTFLFSISFEQIFLLALDISGGFGDSILNGMIPVAMVYVGRYYMKQKSSLFHVRGGKIVLALVFIFFLKALIAELLIRCGFLQYSFHLESLG
jgi:tyrosine-specific transport protein